MRTPTSGSPSHPGTKRSSMSSDSMPGTSEAMPATNSSNPARPATGSVRSILGRCPRMPESSGSIIVPLPFPFPFPAGDLFGLQAGGGVDPDRLCVHVRVGQELDGQRGELRGAAETVREQDVPGQLGLERLGALGLAVARRVDQ